MRRLAGRLHSAAASVRPLFLPPSFDPAHSAIVPKPRCGLSHPRTGVFARLAIERTAEREATGRLARDHSAMRFGKTNVRRKFVNLEVSAGS